MCTQEHKAELFYTYPYIISSYKKDLQRQGNTMFSLRYILKPLRWKFDGKISCLQQTIQQV